MRTSDRPVHAIGNVLDSLAALVLIIVSTMLADRTSPTLTAMADFLGSRFTVLNGAFLVIFAVLWCQCFITLDPYRARAGFLSSLLMNLLGCAVMTATVGIYLTARYAQGPALRIVGFFFISSLAYKTLRMLIRLASEGWRVRPVASVIILGSGRRASKAWRHLRVKYHHSKHVIGFVDNREPTVMPPDIAQRYLGSLDDLASLLRQNAVDELVLAAPIRSEYEMMQRGIALAEREGVRVLCLTDVFSLAHESKAWSDAGMFVELVPKSRGAFLSHRIKRARHVLGIL